MQEKGASNFKNSLYGVLGFIFPLIVTFITTPYIVHKLTPEIYGIYILSTSLIGFMSFLDLGFGQGIVKFVSHYTAKEDFDKVSKIIGVSVSIYIAMGLLGALLLYLFSDYLASKLFKLSIETKKIGSLALKIVAIAFFLNLISILFLSIPKGLQRFDISVKIQNIIWFLYVLSSVFLVHVGKSIIEILIFYCIFQILSIFISVHLSKVLLPNVSFRPKFDMLTFREIFGFSIFVSLNTISANVVTKVDKMIISHFLGPAAVSFYTIPYNLASAVSSLVGSANNFLFPTISYLSSKGNKHLLRYYFLKGLRYTATLSSFLCVPFIIFSDHFILLWMGYEFYKNSLFIAPILGFTFFFSCITSVSLWFYTALNKTHINLVSSLFGSVSYLLAAIVIVPLFGIKGAAFSFMLVLLPFPAYNYYICRLIGVKFQEYLSLISADVIIVTISLIYSLKISNKYLLQDIIVGFILLLSVSLIKKSVLKEFFGYIKLHDVRSFF